MNIKYYRCTLSSKIISGWCDAEYKKHSHSRIHIKVIIGTNKHAFYVFIAANICCNLNSADFADSAASSGHLIISPRHKFQVAVEAIRAHGAEREELKCGRIIKGKERENGNWRTAATPQPAAPSNRTAATASTQPAMKKKIPHAKQNTIS